MVSAIRSTSAWPPILQFACSLAAVIGVFAIQFPLDAKGLGHPFALFLACVFMVALMFGRTSGFFAVTLSTLLSTAFFAPINSIHLMRAFEFIQIEIYVALAVGASIMADQIHRVLISLSDANIQLVSEDTKKALQLREVAHRVANNFASLDALIRQRAMASKDPKIQFAFEQASELVHVVARLNSRLNMAADDNTLDSHIPQRLLQPQALPPAKPLRVRGASWRGSHGRTCRREIALAPFHCEELFNLFRLALSQTSKQ